MVNGRWVWCHICGCHSYRNLRGLAESCAGPPIAERKGLLNKKKGQADRLARLTRGERPRGEKRSLSEEATKTRRMTSAEVIAKIEGPRANPTQPTNANESSRATERAGSMSSATRLSLKGRAGGHVSQWPATTSPPKGGSGGRGSIAAASSGSAQNRDGDWILAQNRAEIEFAERGTEISRREIADALPDQVDQWVEYRRDRRGEKRRVAKATEEWAPRARHQPEGGQRIPLGASEEGLGQSARHGEQSASPEGCSSSDPETDAGASEFILV